MHFGIGVIAIALFTGLSVAEEQYGNCLTNFSVLEQAVLNTMDNRYNIIKAFYSPNSSYESVYVKVT